VQVAQLYGQPGTEYSPEESITRPDTDGMQEPKVSVAPCLQERHVVEEVLQVLHWFEHGKQDAPEAKYPIMQTQFP